MGSVSRDYWHYGGDEAEEDEEGQLADSLMHTSYYFYCDECGSWKITRTDYQKVTEDVTGWLSLLVAIPLFIIGGILQCVFPPVGTVLIILAICSLRIEKKESRENVVSCICDKCGYEFEPFADSDLKSKYHYTSKDIPKWKKIDFRDNQ